MNGYCLFFIPNTVPKKMGWFLTNKALFTKIQAQLSGASVSLSRLRFSCFLVFFIHSAPRFWMFLATMAKAISCLTPVIPGSRHLSNPWTSRTLIPDSTAECFRRLVVNSSLLSLAYSFLLQRPFLGSAKWSRFFVNLIWFSGEWNPLSKLQVFKPGYRACVSLRISIAIWLSVSFCMTRWCHI